MALDKIIFDITTDGSGDFTETSSNRIQIGLLYAVEWKDGDLADGVDAVLSMTGSMSGVDRTLLTLTNANDDAWYFPREDTQDNTGTANGGLDYPLLNGKMKLVVSDGGDTKSGQLIAYYLLG